MIGLNTKHARVVSMLKKQDLIVPMPAIMDLHWEEVVRVVAAVAVLPNHLLHLQVRHHQLLPHPLLHHPVEATRRGQHGRQRQMITIGIIKMMIIGLVTKTITTMMIGGKRF